MDGLWVLFLIVFGVVFVIAALKKGIEPGDPEEIRRRDEELFDIPYSFDWRNPYRPLIDRDDP